MKNLDFYAIKSADISYITFLYIIAAYILALLNEVIFTKLYGTEHSKKTKNQLFFEIIAQVVLSGILSYAGRNIIMKIPSPLHNINNFDHYKVKELNSGATLLMFLIVLQKNLQKKIVLFREML
jgi:hypothetical protein